MSVQESKEVIKKCVCFCDFCTREFKGNRRELWEVEKAIAVCAICGSFLCEAHSLYESDAEVRRCRDRSACHAAAPDQDEGGEGD